MAFCSKCGSNMAEGMSFCPSCGAPVAAATASPAKQESTRITPPAPGVTGPAASGGLAPNIAGLLTYLPFGGWIVAIVFLVIEPFNKEKFVRFHAYQSIFLAVACFVLSIIYSVLTRVLWTIPVMGSIIDALLGLVVWLGILAVWLFMMYKAYNSERYKLPVIGNMAEQQAG